MILTNTCACIYLVEEPTLRTQAHYQVARKSPRASQNLAKSLPALLQERHERPVANKG